MTDLRKAAEMALRQLNRDDEYLGHRSKTRADAINALRQALNVDGVNMSQERVDETVKSEHGPVAYRCWNNHKNADGTFDTLRIWTSLKPEGYGNEPLYAAPPKQEYQYEVVAEHADGTYTTKRIPKRQWVGLTREEINGLARWADEHAAPFYLEFAKAIEAKLKEKNG